MKLDKMLLLICNYSVYNISKFLTSFRFYKSFINSSYLLLHLSLVLEFQATFYLYIIITVALDMLFAFNVFTQKFSQRNKFLNILGPLLKTFTED